jgi:diguanylate cyclase (GGDEF)-like protein/PAS domain S-box-containing protein
MNIALKGTRRHRRAAGILDYELDFRSLLSNIPDTLVSLFDRELRCRAIEGPILTHYGLDAADFVGRRLIEVLPEENARVLDPAMRLALAGESSRVEIEWTRTEAFYEVETLPCRREGTVVGVFVIARDVSRRHLAETQARAAERRLADSFDYAPIGMEMIDVEGRFIRVNAALGQIVGRSHDSLAGAPTARITHPDDAPRDEALRASLLRGEAERYQVEKRMIHADGTEIDVSVHLTLVRTPDGRPRYFVGQVLDITERKRFEFELRRLADHDALTGLLNRRSFEDALRDHLAQMGRYGPTGALIVFDLDGFKAVNDNFGHARGDELIEVIAAGLREELRSTDRVGRLGGDEFAVLLPKADRDDAETVSRKLVERFGRLRVGPDESSVSISVGVLPLEGRGVILAEDALNAADLAMYEAKRAGGDSFALASPRAGISGIGG